MSTYIQLLQCQDLRPICRSRFMAEERLKWSYYAIHCFCPPASPGLSFHFTIPQEPSCASTKSLQVVPSKVKSSPALLLNLLLWHLLRLPLDVQILFAFSTHLHGSSRSLPKLLHTVKMQSKLVISFALFSAIASAQSNDFNIDTAEVLFPLSVVSWPSNSLVNVYSHRKPKSSVSSKASLQPSKRTQPSRPT